MRGRSAGRRETEHPSFLKKKKKSLRTAIVTFGVPGTHDDPPVLWVLLDGVDNVLQLVDPFACVVCLKKTTKEILKQPPGRYLLHDRENEK